MLDGVLLRLRTWPGKLKRILVGSKRGKVSSWGSFYGSAELSVVHWPALTKTLIQSKEPTPKENGC